MQKAIEEFSARDERGLRLHTLVVSPPLLEKAMERVGKVL